MKYKIASEFSYCKPLHISGFLTNERIRLGGIKTFTFYTCKINEFSLNGNWFEDNLSKYRTFGVIVIKRLETEIYIVINIFKKI